MQSTHQTALPDIQFFLSRPCYPLGGTVVGTILIRRPIPLEKMGDSNGKDESSSDFENHTIGSATSSELMENRKTSGNLRETLKAMTVYVAGYCVIDSRWHNISDYTKIYGRLHPHIQISLQDEFDADLYMQSEDTVCFWATNGLKVLSLPERREGSLDHDEIKRGDVLAFTFRADLPPDLPHSISATTCRYFYSADLLIKTDTQQQILKRAFIVTTNPYPTGLLHSVASASSKQKRNNHSNTVITSRVKFGNCVGMAHSNGLPCHLSASEIQRPQGQMTVEQPDRNREVQQDVQTLRVCTSQGKPVCILTVMGTQTMTPGSQIHLQWDFPKKLDQWIPCYLVSACIQGEERALYEDGSSKRTKTFLLDSCHEWIDPGVTDRVSRSMLFSSDTSLEGTPCNMTTDIMEISIGVQVDIIVQEGGGEGEYNTLNLLIPCRVRHELVDEEDVMEEEENRVMSLHELLQVVKDGVGENTEGFSTQDIRSDLKVLATIMEEQLRTRQLTSP